MQLSFQKKKHFCAIITRLRQAHTIVIVILYTIILSTGDEDHVFENYTINIQNQSISGRSFFLNITDDFEVEGNETLLLVISSIDPRIILNTPITSLVTIIDNDRRKYNILYIHAIFLN